MKRNLFAAVFAPVVALLLLLLTSLLACGPRTEPPEAPTAQDEQPNARQAQKEVAPPDATAAPSTPSAIWTAIVSTRDAIDALIRSNQLKGIHDETEALGSLGDRLVNSSTMLDEGRLARVRGAVNQVGRVAESLHDAADEGDAAGAAAEFEKLESLLKLIEAQYPAGALSSRVEEEGARASASPEETMAMDAHAHHHRDPTGREPEQPIPPDAQRVLIQANDFKFSPTRISVQAGRPVAITLTNLGASEHDWVIALKPDVHVHVLPGRSETQVFTVTTPGEYSVICTLPGHKELGMVGSLQVM